MAGRRADPDGPRFLPAGAVALQARYAAGRRVTNALQTNGVLLDDRWAEFLAEHRFLVGVSIDGPPELHDRNRRDPAGQPTLDRVLRGVASLQRARVEFNTLTVVSRVECRASDRGLRVPAWRSARRSTSTSRWWSASRPGAGGALPGPPRAADAEGAAIAEGAARDPVERAEPRRTGTSSAPSSIAGFVPMSAPCSCSSSKRPWPPGRAGRRGSACSTSAAARRSCSSTTAASTPATTTCTRSTGSGTSSRRRSPSWRDRCARPASATPSGTRFPASVGSARCDSPAMAGARSTGSRGRAKGRPGSITSATAGGIPRCTRGRTWTSWHGCSPRVGRPPWRWRRSGPTSCVGPSPRRAATTRARAAAAGSSSSAAGPARGPGGASRAGPRHEGDHFPKVG